MKVEFMMISEGSNYWKQPKGAGEPGKHPTHFPETIECVAGKGIKGDRFFDYKENYGGQISFFSYERFLELQKFLDKEFSPALFRRNVLLSGVDPLQWIGKKFQINGVEFEGHSDCTPCSWMDKSIGAGAYAWLNERQAGGLRARILSSGSISLKDSVSL